MTRPAIRTRGVALFLVIASLFIALMLSIVILRSVLTQSRLSHHEASRIQAYYADQAAINYMFAIIRANSWPVPTTLGATTSYTICRSGCSHNEPDLALPVSQVDILLTATNLGGDNLLQIDVSADYTYTPDVF